MNAPSRQPATIEAAWWLFAATVCGALLRFGAINQLAVEHYDEGVYASNLVFLDDEGEQFPGRAMFAPPLMPLVIDWTTIFWRMPADASPPWLPMLPGFAASLYPMSGQPWMYPIPVIAQQVLAGDVIAARPTPSWAFVVAASMAILLSLILIQLTTQLLQRERIIFTR